MRVLFVDAEPLVHEAMERVLFDVAPELGACFVTSASAALAELAKGSFDAIVSDLALPGMDGVALLSRVASQYPRTLRIVLSGYTDERAALKMVDVAHQFFAKPCASETLYQVLARTEQLTRLLPDRKLQTLAGQAGALPCARPVLLELLRRLDRRGHETDATALAQLMRQDPAMTSKLLQVAGSAFFGSSSSVIDVEAAILRLDIGSVKQLARSFTAPLPDIASAGLDSVVQSAQARSLRIARLAAGMTRLPEDAAAAYVAGLLCDVGQLVLIDAAPERVYLSQSEAAQRGLPAHLAEQATWGATHAEIGAYLLGLWGLPFQIVQAVAGHHAPERSPDDRAGLTHLVWLASCIVDDHEPPSDLLSRFGMEALYVQQLQTYRRTNPRSLR